MHSYYELAIIAFILIGIGTVWKFGAANPVGTGKLQHDVKNIRQETAAQGRQLKEISKTVDAEKLRVDALGDRMGEIEKNVAGIEETVNATAATVAKMDARQDVAGEKIAAIDVRTEATARQVDRLYDHIVKKGMES
tara:strand:- start:97 stop:507 length:411 start_codon:yes stop_codon:yes gene_type:complete